MRITRVVPVLAAVFVLSLSACAAPKIRATKLVPAKSAEAAQLRTVAVLPFEGARGAAFATEIEGTLASININDRQYFTVIERKSLDKVMQEMKLGESGLVDPGTAANIGNMVGAKGIYLGTITEARATDSPYQEERQRCIQTATKVGKKGRTSEECVRWQNFVVPCTKRDGVFAFTPKLIEVESSRIVYAHPIRGESTTKWCRDSDTPLQSEAELVDIAREKAKSAFRSDIAPYYVTMEIQLIDSKDGVTPGEAAEKLGKGLEFAKAGRMDRACELWGEARIACPSAPCLLYNLGICAEITGNPQQALDLYTKADRALGKPDKDVTAALTRVGQELRDREKLSKQVGE